MNETLDEGSIVYFPTGRVPCVLPSLLCGESKGFHRTNTGEYQSVVGRFVRHINSTVCAMSREFASEYIPANGQDRGLIEMLLKVFSILIMEINRAPYSDGYVRFKSLEWMNWVRVSAAFCNKSFIALYWSIISST